MNAPPTHPTSAPSPRRHRRLVVALLWLGSVFAILLVAALVAGNIFLHRAGPLLKADVIETLSNRFDSRVELDRFHASFIDGFQVSGSGLRLFPNHLAMNEPMIAVDRFSFRIFDWRQILHIPIVVNHVQVSGLSIHLPPKGQRSNLPRLDTGPGGTKIDILVRTIDVDHAGLVIENGKPGKVPLDFVIDNLTLQSVTAGRPMRFHATLVNPKPIGDIDTTGDFGPFDAHDPGSTPVDGNYSFRNADLGTIKGIGGILASTGSYQGQLDRIVVDGKTTTPDFSLDIAHHPLPLNTTFHAIVDGTNGDTWLQPVDAWLAKTHIVAQGAIVHTAGIPGRDIRLNVAVDPGRIDDMLQLAVKSDQPMMTGAIQVHTNFDLPPGQGSVLDRLRLDGSFNLTDAHFTSDKIQSKIDALSLRGQGKAKLANKEGQAMKNKGESAKNGGSPSDSASGQNDIQISTVDIASRIRGNFTFANAKVGLPTLNFLVPGAKIDLQGIYGIDGQTLAFTGQARLDAHVSQMVTGWKSLLLKPVDPFFAKDGAGTLVPIKIGGTAARPDIGLDFGHKGNDKNQKPNSGSPPRSVTGR
ncbi:MAG TPA: hypothetical protein VL990_05610 [Acidobacteriaceae bacterium]|nr:hypothetical protein [Acidobacteriaceae bacterium]